MSERQSLGIDDTVSYHTDDSLRSQEGVVYIHEADVPSHLRVVLSEALSCSYRNKKPRQLKSKGAILVLIVTCMVNISFNGALGDILRRFFGEFLGVKEAGILLCLGLVFVRSIPQLGYPVAGWAADVHFGRFKVIFTSLLLMLVGYSLILVTFLIRHFYYPTAGTYITYYAVFPVAFLIINIGLAAFQANIIPFGLDQMPDASTEELSAFIHWYYGSRNLLAGLIPLIPCYVSNKDLSTVYISMCEVLCVTFAILLCIYFKSSLIIEPQSTNPFKLFYKVLRFAMKNKTPIFRSAFTFWEDNIPSRMDLGKKKYGGPFSNEEVEDVKTFIRTTCVLVVVSLFNIAYYTLFFIGILFSNKLSSLSLGNHCTTGLFLKIILDTFPVFFMVAVFEAVVYPFFKVFIPSMLKRIGLGMGVVIVGLLILLALDIYGYQQAIHSNNMALNNISSYNCYLVNDTVEETVDISIRVLPVILLLGVLAETLVYIAVLEFIAAQSPYGMQGMLIGVYYCFRGVSAFIMALLLLFFTVGFKVQHWSISSAGVSCGLPFNATVIVMAVSVLVLYVMVTRKYQHRERDEQFNTRTYAEQYYSKDYGSCSITSTNK